MSKDWSRISGPVTVRAFNGSVRVYATLEAAVRAVGEYNIESLRDRPLGFTYESLTRPRPEYTKTFEYTTHRSYSYHTSVAGGDSHNFYDELGLRIPAWKVQEVYRNLPNAKADNRSYRRWYRVRYNPEKDFRNGSVIGIHCRKAGGYRGHRHVRTQPEITLNEAFEQDRRDYAAEGIFIKGRVRDLPNAWDDLNVSDWEAKSWKNYRRTQYKVKGAGRP